MTGINFAGKGLNQKIFSKKAVRATVGKRSSAFRAIMGNKEISHVIDTTAEKRVFYEALKKRGQASGKKGITKNVLKKVLGDIEHSGEFSHKEMHKLGEELIGGVASGRIVREHSAEHNENHSQSKKTNPSRRDLNEIIHKGHLAEKVDDHSQLSEQNIRRRNFDEVVSKQHADEESANSSAQAREGNIRRRNFDEVLDKQHSRYYEKIQGADSAFTQNLSSSSKFAPSKNAITPSQFQSDNTERKSNGDEIKQSNDAYSNENEQEGQLFSAQERIQKLKILPIVKQEEKKSSAIETFKNSSIRPRYNEIAAKQAGAFSSAQERIRELTNAVMRDMPEKQQSKRYEEISSSSVVKKPDLLLPEQTVVADSKQSNPQEQAIPELIKSEKPEKQVQKEGFRVNLSSDFSQNDSQAFGYVPQHLKAIGKGVDYDKIKALIVKVQKKEKKVSGEDNDDDEDEDGGNKDKNKESAA